MPQRSQAPRSETSATKSRSFRTFLLMQQFAAKEIGERIKEARRQASLTQDELADLVEVTTRTIQAYEAGDIDAYRKLNKLASVLNREVSWLLHGAEEVSPGDERVRQVVQEELGELRAAIDRVENLLRGAQPREHRARP